VFGLNPGSHYLLIIIGTDFLHLRTIELHYGNPSFLGISTEACAKDKLLNRGFVSIDQHRYYTRSSNTNSRQIPELFVRLGNTTGSMYLDTGTGSSSETNVIAINEAFVLALKASNVIPHETSLSVPHQDCDTAEKDVPVYKARVPLSIIGGTENNIEIARYDPPFVAAVGAGDCTPLWQSSQPGGLFGGASLEKLDTIIANPQLTFQAHPIAVKSKDSSNVLSARC
jgi:hypothetical protein